MGNVEERLEKFKVAASKIAQPEEFEEEFEEEAEEITEDIVEDAIEEIEEVDETVEESVEVTNYLRILDIVCDELLREDHQEALLRLEGGEGVVEGCEKLKSGLSGLLK